MTTEIRTNNVPRDVLARWELTEEESKEFDYLPPDEGNFFRFKGEVYDLGEFMRIIPQGGTRTHIGETFDLDGTLKGWDGIMSDSYFHGLLVRYVEDDWERIVVGEYFS